MKQVTTTQERMFTGDIPRPVNLSMAIAIHILDPNTGMCQDPREGLNLLSLPAMVYCVIIVQLSWNSCKNVFSNIFHAIDFKIIDP